MLTSHQIEKNWSEIRSGIRNLWGALTEDEINHYKGNVYEISGVVEERYGEEKYAIKQKLDQLMESFDNPTDRGDTPDVASFERSPLAPRTAEESALQDSDIKSRSSERSVFDKRTAEKAGEELNDPAHHSNYNGANPNRTELAP